MTIVVESLDDSGNVHIPVERFLDRATFAETDVLTEGFKSVVNTRIKVMHEWDE